MSTAIEQLKQYREWYIKNWEPLHQISEDCMIRVDTERMQTDPVYRAEIRRQLFGAPREVTVTKNGNT